MEFSEIEWTNDRLSQRTAVTGSTLNLPQPSQPGEGRASARWLELADFSGADVFIGGMWPPGGQLSRNVRRRAR